MGGLSASSNEKLNTKGETNTNIDVKCKTNNYRHEWQIYGQNSVSPSEEAHWQRKVCFRTLMTTLIAHITCIFSTNAVTAWSISVWQESRIPIIGVYMLLSNYMHAKITSIL